MENIKFQKINKLGGPLLAIENPGKVSYGELVRVKAENFEAYGRVLDVSYDIAIIESFKNLSGLKLDSTSVTFTGKPLMFGVSPEIMGRIFDGVGHPIDNLPEPAVDQYLNINGYPINPMARAYPKEFIPTGVTAIDAMNTLIKGQKLPIFSGAGLPHNLIAAQIVNQAGEANPDNFAIIFAAVGISHDVGSFFRQNFEQTGALKKVVMFLNYASDPVVERIVTPRMALTAGEYMAFELGMDVLVVITDITNYCEALREVASSKGEIPSRKGYPGYLYSDLSSIYERAGRIHGRKGSLTQLPILSMPNDDITHPIPDLTGYITEGQVVVSREMHMRGFYPPINVLPSLSRLMKDGIGEGFTRADHPHLANQLYACYAKVKDVESLASVIGEEELNEVERAYLNFGKKFEREFVCQKFDENRSIEETLNLGWKMLKSLPEQVLTRVTEEEIGKYYRNV
ncbi:MAG: V-type ATP synthase subunit B [Candidatus Wallbacteria bacterium]|nr:V-type ATP synthase subunit B [Candidatus Wallbacteria bacterium]